MAVESYGFPENVIESMAVVIADGTFLIGEDDFGGEEGFLMIKVDGKWYVSTLITYYDLELTLAE